MRVLRIVFFCTAIVAASSCDLFKRPRQSEKINERTEVSNNVFKIRVTAYAEENPGFIGGAYYVFESAPSSSNDWRKITTVRSDDPVPIPRQQIRFVSNLVGYVFMIWMYAVTTDGGVTWNVWNAFDELPQWRDHSAIDQIQINPDGTGSMSFRASGVPHLRTGD